MPPGRNWFGTIPPGRKGVWLGLLNVLVVAVGFGVMRSAQDPYPCGSHVHAIDDAILVFILGLLPGLITGGVLGLIAAKISRLRLAKLGGCAVAMVGVLGLLSDAPVDFMVLSTIPTFAIASVLERWTRPKPPDLAVAIRL